MENFFGNKNSINTTPDINETKKELDSEKEKKHLELRKNKLYNLISSKRKINLFNETNNLIKKNYDLNYEEIANIPNTYKIDIPKFIQKVRIKII